MREQETTERARHCEQQTLREELSQHAAPRGADRQTHGDFTLARGAAGEHQIRQICARDEQHERRRREQQEQRIRVRATQLGRAGCRWRSRE